MAEDIHKHSRVGWDCEYQLRKTEFLQVFISTEHFFDQIDL